MSIEILGAKILLCTPNNGHKMSIFCDRGDITCTDDLLEKIATGYYDNYDNDIEIRIPDGCRTISMTKQEAYKDRIAELEFKVKRQEKLLELCKDYAIDGNIPEVLRLSIEEELK